MNDAEYQRLIPELKTINDGKSLSIELWLHWIGDYRHTIAYSTFFWPEFTEHEGCVFLGREIPSTYNEWKMKFSGIISSIERMLNHVHMDYIFDSKQGTHEQLIYLGKKLKEIWTLKLEKQFPNKQFIVALNEDAKPNINPIIITFYQSDKSLKTR
jgi:hypothetical protein